MNEIHFDAELGLLDAAVFSDAQIYESELERIFARQWLFVCPASWVAEPGAFVVSRMGATSVVAWCGSNGPRVFINRCLGSETLVAAADRGSAASLHCRCHGWKYSTEGDGDAIALEKVPLVEIYAGLLFACMAADAPSFVESLGDFRFYLDLIPHSFLGGIEILGDAPMRTKIAANWKLAVEASSGDVYQEKTLTRASHDVLGDVELRLDSGVQVATATGAALLVDSAEGLTAGLSASNEWRVFSATLFPNLSYDGRAGALHVWHPCGPQETELQTYCLTGADEKMPEKENRLRSCRMRFGAAGFETMDAESVWSSITRTSRGVLARRTPLNFQMGIGKTRRSNLPGFISDLFSESNQRAFYSWWQCQLHRPAGDGQPRTMRLSRWVGRSPGQR